MPQPVPAQAAMTGFSNVAANVNASPIRQVATSGLAWSAVVSAAVVLWILFPLGGLDYYMTPLAVRGYSPAHRLLRPSGPVGQTLGVVGGLLMLVPFVYMLRKRIPWLKSVGSLKTWLEIHLFCGIAGPVFVTFHTAFKFNGIVSAAYWSIVTVVLSGFVGRYLYVRIPRSLRGTELTRAELDARAAGLGDGLARSVASPAVLARLRAFELAEVPPSGGRVSVADWLFGEIALGRRLKALDGELQRSQLPEGFRREIIGLIAERSMLLRRVAYLERTRKLFNLWHVFHLPLVYLQLAIVAAHVAVTLYLGYVPFRW